MKDSDANQNLSTLNQQYTKSFDKKDFNDLLICNLCKGYFRFASTIVECGHTFCKVCISKFIQEKKRYECPTCGTNFERNHSKSIKKDPAKQNLVDTLYPAFSQSDKLLMKRVNSILTNVDLEGIIDKYYFTTNELDGIQTKNKVEKKVNKKFLKLIKEELKISFEEFKNIIQDEHKYKSFIDSNKEKNIKILKVKISPYTSSDKEHGIYDGSITDFPKTATFQALTKSTFPNIPNNTKIEWYHENDLISNDLTIGELKANDNHFYYRFVTK